MASSERLFVIREEYTEQLLFVDDSGDEENVRLDDEDLGFLENDVDPYRQGSYNGATLN